VLSHQIAKHFSIQCSPETKSAGVLKAVGARAPDLTFRMFEAVQFDHLMHGTKRNYSILFPEHLRDLKIADHPRDFLEGIISQECYSEGIHVLDQTPRNGEYAPLLRFLYPDALILLVARNPIDTLKSKQKTPWGRGNPLALLALWARPYAETMNLAALYGTENFRVVRYAKLDDEAYRDRLFNWIERLGIVPRDQPVDIIPKNHAGSDWSKAHMQQSTSEVVISRKSKATGMHGFAQKFGDGLLVAALWRIRAPGSNRYKFSAKVIHGLSYFAIRVLGR